MLYGGAAGAGKSHALLLECVRHIKNPKYSAVIFRNSHPQLTMPGGLIERSTEIYPHVGGKLKAGPPACWVFPSGARIDLRYIAADRDVLNYQGSEITTVCFDEVTMVSEYAFTFMLSRNRSTSGIKPTARMTCNPEADSWLANWIDWYINDAGFPIPERSGVVRYFVREHSQIHWADTPEELSSSFPDTLPKSFTFVSAKITDNPSLLSIDPGYIANLQALHPVDRARLLEGNWKIRNEAGLVFQRGWFDVKNNVPTHGTLVRAWDFAGTVKHLKNDPDSTVGVKMLRSQDGIYYVLDVIAAQISAAQVNNLVLQTARQDGIECKIRWEIEPGASGKINSATLIKVLAGFDAMGVYPSGDKLVRAKPFATQASTGNVVLLRSSWVDAYLAELHAFPEGKHDDRVDASSLAFNELAKPIVRRAPSVVSYNTY